YRRGAECQFAAAPGRERPGKNPGPAGPEFELVLARPAQDLSAARPLGIVAPLRDHSFCGGRGRAPDSARARRIAASDPGPAPLALLLAGRAAHTRGRRIFGRAPGPPRARPFPTN